MVTYVVLDRPAGAYDARTDENAVAERLRRAAAAKDSTAADERDGHEQRFLGVNVSSHAVEVRSSSA